MLAAGGQDLKRIRPNFRVKESLSSTLLFTSTRSFKVRFNLLLKVKVGQWSRELEKHLGTRKLHKTTVCFLLTGSNKITVLLRHEVRL